MISGRWKILLPALILLSLALASMWFFTRSASVEFLLMDEISELHVWDSTVSIQDKEINLYYQTNKGVTEFTLNNLRPGMWTLSAVAPYYESHSREVILRRGRNHIEPVLLRGSVIPNLTRYFVFERQEDGIWYAEIRPVNSYGNAILHHPWLDIRMNCAISKDDIVLYEGQLERRLDPLISNQFPYQFLLPPMDEGVKGPVTIRYAIFVPENGTDPFDGKKFEYTSQDVSTLHD